MTTRIITLIGFAGVITALFALEFLARRKDSRIPALGEWLGYVMRPWALPAAGPARLAAARLALLLPVKARAGLLPVKARAGRSARLCA